MRDEASPAERRLARAKEAAEALTTSPNRKWLTTVIKAYGGDMYTTRLHILEGTPPRAYIVENEARGVCSVLDMEGQWFGEARYGDFEPVRWFPARRKKN